MDHLILLFRYCLAALTMYFQKTSPTVLQIQVSFCELTVVCNVLCHIANAMHSSLGLTLRLFLLNILPVCKFLKGEFLVDCFLSNGEFF